MRQSVLYQDRAVLSGEGYYATLCGAFLIGLLDADVDHLCEVTESLWLLETQKKYYISLHLYYVDHEAHPHTGTLTNGCSSICW